LKVGNFLGSIKSKHPKVIGMTTEEINNLSTPHSQKLQPSTFIGINNAFNPTFFNLSKKRKNLELMRRIDDTGFLPLMLQKL
jgi:hypothetical protein